MIGQLRGTVSGIDEDIIILDVNGVGYEVFVLPRLAAFLEVGAELSASIETIVREDFIKLYGFETVGERQCFRLLQTVQGVGAKHALAILHVLGSAELYDAIAMKDATALSRAHGVGARIAQRIVTELESKVGQIASAGMSNPFSKKSVQSRQTAKADADIGARADAVSALSNLGYDGVEARRAVAAAIAQNEALDGDVETLIKSALKELAAA